MLEMLEARQLLSVPVVPSGLQATATSSTAIDVSWADNSANETGFTVEYATDPWFAFNYGTIDTAANATNQSITNLAPSSKYYIRLFAFNGEGPSSNSSTVNTTTSAAYGTFILDPNSTEGTWASFTYGNVGKTSHQPAYPSESQYAMVYGQTRTVTGTVGLSTATLPTGAAVSSVTLWAFAESAAGSPQTINWSVYTGGDPLIAAQNAADSQDWSRQWWYHTWSGLSLNQSALDALQITASINHTNGNETDIYQVYAEVTYTVLAPTNLSATAASETQIELSWTDNSSNETAFYIDRATDSSFGTDLVTSSVGTNVTSYSATGLASNTTYYFRVRAYNATDASGNTGTVSASTLDSIPVAPSDLEATPNYLDEVCLTWTDNSDNETGFLLQRASDNAFTQDLVTANLSPNQDGYNVGQLVTGNTYYFRICAVGSAGSSSWSETETFQKRWPRPENPTDLAATAVSQTQISLVWTQNFDHVLGYDIYCGITPGVLSYFSTVEGDVRSFLATGLSAGTSYSFRVRPWNESGMSDGSPLASAATLVVGAPVVSGIETASLAYTENDPATLITSTIAVSDTDSSTLAGATIQITGNYQDGADLLGFTNTATITGDLSGDTLTLSGIDTLANYQAALRAVTYRNASDNPGTAVRTVSITVNDGSLDSNTVTRQITVTAVNEAPTALTLYPDWVSTSQGIATSVGWFTGYDMDSAGLSYSVVSGDGDTDNAMFDILSDGTLITLSGFQQKSVGQIYSVRAQVSDGPLAYAAVFTLTVQEPVTEITSTASAGPDATGPGGIAFGTDGGDPISLAYSGGAVRLADGREYHTVSDVDPADGGIVSGMVRTWSNDSDHNRNFGFGNGWSVSQIPVIIDDGGASIRVLGGGASTREFVRAGSPGSYTYAAKYFNKEQMFASGSQLTLIDSLGNVTEFSATENGIRWPVSYTDSGGNVTTFTPRSASDHRPASIARKIGATDVETIGFTWLGDYVQDATVSRLFQDNPSNPESTAMQEIRKVVYAYSGEYLTQVTIKQATLPIDYCAYRYNGRRLSIVLEGDAYARAVLNGLSLDTSSDDDLKKYANLAFGYSGDTLSSQTMQGLGTYLYDYRQNAGTAGTTNLMLWRYRTEEILPDTTPSPNDNDRRIVYSNIAGEVLLDVFEDRNESGGVVARWGTAYQYDTQGRLLQIANPSAIAPTALNTVLNATTAPDDLGYTTSLVLPSGGLVHFSNYDANGYLAVEGDQQGRAGTQIKVAEYVYNQQLRTRAGIPGYQPGWLVTQQNQYPQTSGNPVTTGYQYAFYNGTDAVLTRTTTLPKVTPQQNGSNFETEHVDEQFDTLGRLVSLTDADGYVHQTAYVPGTGAIKSSNTAGITTTYISDGLGRIIRIIDPQSHVTTITYTENQAYTEVRTRHPDVGANRVSPPDEITRYDRRTGEVSTLTVAHDGGDNTPVLSLSVSKLNEQGQLVSVLRYDKTLQDGMTYWQSGGVAGTGSCYYTGYGYDAQGHQEKVIAGREYVGSRGGIKFTITRTVYDALGRVSSTWVGTDDATRNSSPWSPTNAGDNMVQLSENQYDDGLVGDSNLTEVTLLPGDGTPNRVTQTKYDWRDQAVLTETGVVAATGVHPPITYLCYDNLGRVISQETYDGDGIDFANLDVATAETALFEAGVRRAYTKTLYDDRGRVYRTLTYNIDQTLGTGTQALATDMWYNNRDQVIKTKSPGGLVTKLEYDALGQVIMQSTTDGGATTAMPDSGWTDAGNVYGDVVLEQGLYQYDASGNVLLTVTKQRDHDAMGTGDLTVTNARISAVANWYDEANRLLTTVDYGNNGDDCENFVRPTSAPAQVNTIGWDPWLRTDYRYGPLGLMQDVTDPRGIVTRTLYDSLGRRTVMWEAYEDGDPGTSPAKDDDRRTRWGYNGFDQVEWEATQSLEVNSQTQQMTVREFLTDYVYGVSKYDEGHALNHSGLLASVTYGRRAGDNPPASTLARETYTRYNALGEVLGKTLQNTTQHTYEYNVLGRLASDTKAGGATTQSPTPERLRYEYDALGRVTKATTDTSATVVANQVQREYDGLGNLITEWQDHDGEVQKTGSDITPSVRYAYDANFTLNYSRLQATYYPNGRALWTGYDNTDLNDALSRPGYVADSDYQGNVAIGPTASSPWMERYEYLGVGTVVGRIQAESNYPNSTHRLEYYNAYPTRDDAGDNDPYDGLDRFGRVISQNWYQYSQSFAYAYGADGEILYAKSNDWRSELYQGTDISTNGALSYNGYDRLGRLQQWHRGTISDSDWDGVFDTFTQSAQNHPRNQSWEITPATGGHYDRVQQAPTEEDPKQRLTWQRDIRTGDFTRPEGSADPESPLADRNSLFSRTDLFAKFDAWGRLSYKATATLRHVGDENSPYYTYDYEPNSGKPQDVQFFEYDAFGRRIGMSWTLSVALDYGRATTGRVDYYLDSLGRVIEERQGEEGNPQAQMVWSLSGPNMLVTQDVGGTIEGSLYGPTPSGSGMTTRLWTAQGPDGSVWEVRYDGGGTSAAERYIYTPEGQVLTQTCLGNTWYVLGGNANYGVSRYLWRGYRAETYGDESADLQGVYDKYDGLYWTGTTEHDSWRGGPLQEDVSAYLGANKYDEWTPTALNYPYDGTGGFWNSIGTPGSATHIFFNSSRYDMSTVSTPTADAWAKVSGWVSVVALTAATGGAYGLAYLAGGVTAGAVGGAAYGWYNEYTGADYWRSVETGANVGALVGSFPGALSKAGTAFVRYGDEGAAGLLNLVNRMGGGTPAAALAEGSSMALPLAGESAAVLGMGTAPVNWGGMAGWGANAVFSAARGAYGPYRVNGRSIAGKVQLEVEEYGLSRTQHFRIANRQMAQMIREHRAYGNRLVREYGISFVKSVLRGQRPEGWTWHHALTSQAGGETGWLYLVRKGEHWNQFSIYHPLGYGGYEQWAIPAGKP